MISLVIPAYNESAVIENTVRASAEALDHLGEEWELLVVDDGSTDDTAARAQRAMPSCGRVISYAPNRGKGFAVRTGMLEAKGEIVFFTDSDLAYGLDVLSGAVALFRESGCDVVAGSRKLDKEAYRAYPPLRRVASRVFALAAKILSGLDYDTQCGFKGFTEEAAKKLFSRSTENGFVFDFEVMLLSDRLGLRVQELPVRILNHGSSKISVLRDSLLMARDILRVRRRVRMTGRDLP